MELTHPALGGASRPELQEPRSQDLGLAVSEVSLCLPWPFPPSSWQDEREEVCQVREDRVPDGGDQMSGEGETEMSGRLHLIPFSLIVIPCLPTPVAVLGLAQGLLQVSGVWNDAQSHQLQGI